MTEARRVATHADLNGLPDRMVGEILGGELYTSPRPASRHARAASVLGGELVTGFGRRKSRGPGGWVILDEPELHLGADVVVPDVAGWRRDRMPEIPDVAAFTLAPDWVCEVLSPATARFDRQQKMPIYAREGVAHLWLVEPTLRTLEVFRRQGDHWLLLATHGGDTQVRAEPFDAVELDLSEWWSDPDPKAG